MSVIIFYFTEPIPRGQSMQAMLGPPPAGPAGKFRQFVKQIYPIIYKEPRHLISNNVAFWQV